MLLRSTVASSNFAVGLNEVSVTAPVMTFFILVRTKAAPLPGFTCWKLTTVMTCPSISKVTPFLKSPAVIIYPVLLWLKVYITKTFYTTYLILASPSFTESANPWAPS